MPLTRAGTTWLAAMAALLVLLAPQSARAEKFVLSLFHFNVQYVAGGLVGFSFLPSEELDLDNDEIEDLIVTESFDPVLDLYAAHPTWGANIELQGYMLDVLATRHPGVLAKLRNMAKSGQIEVVSFHYSDQLFIGYPQEDWERSQALTAQTFAKHDVPLSRSVFCQEGQAGEAMAERFVALGYRNMIWPKNLFGFQHGDAPAPPLYQFGQGYMLLGGKGVAYSQGGTDIEMQWSFFDDGELLATGDLNPYFADIFRKKPAVLAEYEQKLMDLEAQGWDVATVDQYVEAVKSKVTPTTPPPLLDGTWQPGSTTAVFKWLGSRGIWPGERDNHVRSLGALAHRELVAAEAAAKSAGIRDDVETDLHTAWRALFLSQVTDASGINPFRGEVEYGIAHATEALRLARNVIRRAKAALGATQVVIDPDQQTMISASEADPLRGASVDAPFSLTIESGERAVETLWEEVDPGHRRVELRFGPGLAQELSVTFPGELSDELIVTRALADAVPVTYHRSDFTFADFHLALPTGVISLSPTRFVIKDMARVHLAARITRDTGDIQFRDQTVADDEGATWVFHVFDGSAADAVVLARRINVSRRLSR